MIGELGGISHAPRVSRPGDTSAPPTSTRRGCVEEAGDQMIGEHGGIIHPLGDLGLGTPVLWHQRKKKNWYRCYYPHTSRESVSPEFGICLQAVTSAPLNLAARAAVQQPIQISG